MGQVEDFLAENAVVRCRYGTRMTKIGCYRYREAHPDACRGCPELGGARIDKKSRKRNWGTGFKRTIFKEAGMEGVDRLFEVKETVETKMIKPNIEVPILDQIDAIDERTHLGRDEIINSLLAEGLRVYDEKRETRKG